MAKTYSEKLKDPKWQRKRLDILNRDEWTCQKCYDTETTLHVHHRRYSNDYKEPWDYPDALLVTLCEKCHAEETAVMNDTLKYLGEVFRDKFFSDQILNIIKGVELYCMPHMPDVCACAISNTFANPDEAKRVIDSYFKMLKEKSGHTITQDMPF